MKHNIYILILLLVPLSMTKASHILYGCAEISSIVEYIGELKSDTTKSRNVEIMFGRSYLKNHIELHGKRSRIDEKSRDKWIRKVAKKLLDVEEISNLEKLERNEIIHEEFYQLGYRLIFKGSIDFADGSYIRMMSSSAHSNPKVGDITLALTDAGDVYINQGHICGDIIHFITQEKQRASSSIDFLRYFESDTDGSGWIAYDLDEIRGKKNKSK